MKVGTGALFSNGDTVMAADKGSIYEAKILKSMSAGSGWHYFIHFNGWARRYDTWIDESMLSLASDTKRMENIREATKSSVTGKVNSSKDSSKKKPSQKLERYYPYYYLHKS